MRKINPEIMSWAINWNGYSVDGLLSAFPKLPEWLDGTRQPTFKQLEKFSARTHLPVPYFFRNSTPEVRLQIADFRSTKSSNLYKVPSPELFDTIDEMLMRQGWMSDFFSELGYEKNKIAGLYAECNIDSLNPASVATNLRQILQLMSGWSFTGTSSMDDAFRVLRSAIEKCGISVSVAGYAKGATNRAFDVEEFRGFVLFDEYAPIIFINGKDSKCAQLFTLVHELAHLALGNTGLFDEISDIEWEPSEERFCDKVAAEFLMPADVFVRMWDINDDKAKVASKVASKLKVSFVSCIRRAEELSLIDKSVFWDLFNAHKRETDEVVVRLGNGGNYHATKGANLGNVFTEAVYLGIQTGRLLYSEAYKLTSMKAETFNKYYREKGYAL